MIQLQTNRIGLYSNTSKAFTSLLKSHSSLKNTTYSTATLTHLPYQYRNHHTNSHHLNVTATNFNSGTPQRPVLTSNKHNNYPSSASSSLSSPFSLSLKTPFQFPYTPLTHIRKQHQSSQHSQHSSSSLSTPPQPQQQQLRNVSSFYTWEMQQGSKTVKARISLLKSPGYIGHYTSRMNRPYNEDRYFAGVLQLPTGSSLRPMSSRYKTLEEEYDYDDNDLTSPHLTRKENLRPVFNFAVFDGHGGQECSQFLQENLARYVESCDLTSSDRLADQYKTVIGGYWKRWRNGFSKYMAKMRAIDDFQIRLPIAFLQADFDYMQQYSKAGSTCTSIYLYTDDEYSAPVGRHQVLTPGAFWEQGQSVQLVVAHVGDTRCIICDSLGEAHPLTSNHHPSSPIESMRLQRYASSFMTDSFGESRFLGSFANTRSFGDFAGKARGITAEPDILEHEVGTPSGKFPVSNKKTHLTGGHASGNEAFIVLVSDGVSGMMSDQEIVDIIITTADRGGSLRGTPQLAAEEVVKYAEILGGDDNATCMVIRLGGWNQWPTNSDRTAELRENRMKTAFDNRRQ